MTISTDATRVEFDGRNKEPAGTLVGAQPRREAKRWKKRAAGNRRNGTKTGKPLSLPQPSERLTDDD